MANGTMAVLQCLEVILSSPALLQSGLNHWPPSDKNQNQVCILDASSGWSSLATVLCTQTNLRLFSPPSKISDYEVWNQWDKSFFLQYGVVKQVKYCSTGLFQQLMQSYPWLDVEDTGLTIAVEVKCCEKQLQCTWWALTMCWHVDILWYYFK